LSPGIHLSKSSPKPGFGWKEGTRRKRKKAQVWKKAHARLLPGKEEKIGGGNLFLLCGVIPTEKLKKMGFAEGKGKRSEDRASVWR